MGGLEMSWYEDRGIGLLLWTLYVLITYSVGIYLQAERLSAFQEGR